jgi:hypothetical protein
LFLTYSVFSIISAIPTKAQKEEAFAELEDIESPTYDDKNWEYELSRIKTPTSPNFPGKHPMTPRTLAFNKLEGNFAPGKTNRLSNRDLPLRHHISMGDETYVARLA